MEYEKLRNQILDYLKLTLTKKRFEHILGVEETSLELAKIYNDNNDLEKVSLIALLHDISKEMNKTWHLEQLQMLGIDPTNFHPNIYHGLTAKVLYRQLFNVNDEIVDTAISNHTMFALNLDIFAQILFVADYSESRTRTHPDAEEVRNIFGDVQLSQLVIMKLQNGIEYSKSRKDVNIDISYLEELIEYYSM